MKRIAAFALALAATTSFAEPRCPSTARAISFWLDGAHDCGVRVEFVGLGLKRTSNAVDYSTQLLMDHGSGSEPRHRLASYAHDRPFSAGLQFLSAGPIGGAFMIAITGRTLDQWHGPVIEPVLPGMTNNTDKLDRRGAFVVARIEPSPTTDYLLQPVFGVVSIDDYDLAHVRFHGTFCVWLVAHGELHVMAGSFDAVSENT